MRPEFSPKDFSVRCALALVCLLSAGSLTARATTLQRLSLEQMTSLSTRILHARAIESHSRWNEEHTQIFTYTTFEVLDSLTDGDLPEQIVVKQFGGKVGHLIVEAHGEPLFRPGEESVLFLVRDRQEPETERIVGLAEGNYRVVRDRASQEKVVVSTTEGASYFNPRTQTFTKSTERLRLEELKERVRQLLSTESPENREKPGRREQ